MDEVITSRGKDPFFPGVLLRSREDANKWVLHEAERFIFAVQGPGYRRFQDEGCLSVTLNELRQYSYGQEVSFSHGQAGHARSGTYVTEFSSDTGKYNEKGYLFIGEKFSRKHFESIFQIKKTGRQYDIGEDSRSFQNLIEIHRVYNNEKVNKNLKNGEPFYGGFEAARTKGAIPVWYRAIKKRDGEFYLSLSFASIGRQAYEHTMGNLIQEKFPCRKRNAVCRACALFGMAGEESLGSHIRITDAVLAKPKDCFAEDEFAEKGLHTLKELASPKISYLPFYTDQPGMEGWSYDKEGMMLRGRKYYWHNQKEGAWKAERTKDGEPIRTERNATMQLVRDNTSFSFHVYYDRITKTQLDELIWTLTLGENKKDSNLCYKIGHGKPIGLGSAKIRIDRKRERSFDLETGYMLREEKYADKPTDIPVPQNFLCVKELRKIMDLNATAGKQVSYPFIDTKGVQVKKENDAASHKWFNQNYQLGNRKGARQPWKGIFDACREPFFAYRLTYENDNAFVAGNKGNAAIERNRGSESAMEGNIYQAVVTGHEERFVYLSVNINGGTKKIKLHCKNIKFCRARFGELDQALPVHTHVEIKYMGQENGYDQWHCIGKI